MSEKPIYRCAGPYCPGFSYPASAIKHPVECVSGEMIRLTIELSKAELSSLRHDLRDAENDSLELEGWTLYALGQRLAEAATQDGGEL